MKLHLIFIMMNLLLVSAYLLMSVWQAIRHLLVKFGKKIAPGCHNHLEGALLPRE